MENDILDSLEDIGYQGPLLEEGIFEKEIEKGQSSVPFTKLVEWLAKELGAFYGLDDLVNAITGPEDAETFAMELSGFLREYGCPYEALTEGPITERLSPRINKIQLLDFLLTELQAARMTAVNKPHLLQKAVPVAETAESETSTYMKLMLIALGFPKPPPGITSFQLFTKVEAKVKELIGAVYAAHMSKPLLKARLSDKQWKDIEFINSALRQEYEVRRDMMLKRLDVTIQSFKWSDRAKQKDDQLAAVYQPIRRQLLSKVVTDVPHLLAAREDLLNIEKTSGGKSREKTKCDLNRVLIGRVPDRGGRAYEHEVPPPEMPGFQQRQQQPQGQRQGRGGGGRGGDRGGRGGDRGGRGGGGRGGYDSRPQSAHSQGGGGGGWQQGGAQYQNQQPQANNAAAGFFGGGGGGGYQAPPANTFGYQGYQDVGQHGGGGYNQQGGGGGYNQQGGGGGYNQQGGGGYNQQGGGGYNQQGGGGYNQQGGGGGYNQQGGGGGYQDRGGRGGRGRGGRGGGGGRGGRGRGRGT